MALGAGQFQGFDLFAEVFKRERETGSQGVENLEKVIVKMTAVTSVE